MDNPLGRYNAVSGPLEAELVKGASTLVLRLTRHFLKGVQNKLAVFLFGLTQQTAELL
jgi:hypothetical protein